MEEAVVKLREEQTRLTKLILAIEALDKSSEWQTMKELLFDRLVESIKKQIHSEAIATEVKPNNLYRLQGELKWARKYADLNEFASTLKVELENIKKRIN